MQGQYLTTMLPRVSAEILYAEAFCQAFRRHAVLDHDNYKRRIVRR
jgi:hypothetical protein